MTATRENDCAVDYNILYGFRRTFLKSPLQGHFPIFLSLNSKD